ncbi:MAG: hypothetical protein WC337_11660 [Candidatus Muiribacteriota bacterium]|jgi:hypothetical protein
MCKDGNHESIIILTTPGNEHQIYWCEKCDVIIGTSEDFSDVNEGIESNFDVEDEKNPSSQIYYLHKPIKAVI